MNYSKNVSRILENYNSCTPGVRANLARLLMHGKLSNTGRLLFYPIDQGFEHGPFPSFLPNPDSFDPLYHFNLAIEAGVSAIAAPLGFLELGAHRYSGLIPMILKVNSSSILMRNQPCQYTTACVDDALHLGCVGVGFTIYPGSDDFGVMLEDLSVVINEAKRSGLCVVVWAYPRGGDLQKNDETSLDVISYAAHTACLMGADIIKVKLPSKNVRGDFDVIDDLETRIKHVLMSAFDGRRMIVFSGGGKKDANVLLDEVRAIRSVGGTGSIIGRNVFQRNRPDALAILNDVIGVLKQ